MRFLAKKLIVSGVVLSALTLAGCSAFEERAACALSDGGRTTVNLTVDDCKQVQEAMAAAQRAQQAAAAQAAAAEREKAVQKYRNDVAQQMRDDEGKGFKATSLENFKLNGQDLAHHDAKVAVQGVYVKTNRGEFLMPSSLSTSQVDVTRTPDEGVNLISRSASRSAKRAFAQCQKDSVKSKLGCPMTILGEAVLCDRTTIFGMAQAPCLAVDDTWYIPPPG
jgi:outer membrane murein-binding lipoprotein Lpp